MDKHRDNLKLAIPAYSAFIVVAIATALYFGGLGPSYLKSLILLSTFLGILAFGQAATVLSGGMDLSIPWTITLCAAMFSGLVAGLDVNLWWSVPVVLACGLAIGIINGVGIAIVGLPPIVMTLSANGILQGIALYYTGGSPQGFAPPALRWFISGTLFGVPAVIWSFAIFIVAAVLLLSRTYLGRRIYAIGNNVRASHLSGINVQSTQIAAYAISGFCAALVGILLVGFNGAANLGMGDEYLLPSIAVVVAGGVLITGGRGHYLGVLGGVLLLIALQILIGGTTLPDSVRGIIFGFVMLGALMALQQRRPS
jgi:ribose transport system permease protein